MICATRGRPFRFFTGAALAASLFTLGTSAQAQDPDLAIGGGPSGGVFNVVATGLGQLLREEFPDSLVDVQPGGSGPNLLRVSSGRTDLGITSANNAWDAWHGKDPATPDEPVRNVRGLMTFFPSAIQIWVDADSDIQSLEDLRGKDVSAGQRGQTSWLAFQNLLDVHDMSIEDIEADGGQLHELSWAESQNGLRNGQIDAVMWVALYPHSTVLENETARPMRALSLDEDKVEEYLEEHGGGFEAVTLPVGLYEGQEEPALTVGTKTMLFANESMDEEIAYRITKTIWDNLDEFKQVHSLLSYMSEETVGQGMAIPLHPGAQRFYEEMSIETGESTLD